MESNSINTRQLCLILAVFFPVGKLILVPSMLANEAKNDLLLSAGILYLLQGAAVFCMLFLMRRTKKDLFSLLQERIGEPLTRTCYLLLSLYLLFICLFPLLEQKAYVIETMFDTRPTIIVFLPFFFFSVYAGSKSLTSAGRSADLSAFFFLPAFLTLLAMALGSADFTALLPLGYNSPESVLKGSLSVLASFAEAAYLLPLVGHVRVEGKFLLKTSISYLLGALAVLLFLAVFYGIFSTVSVRELYAVAKIARYYDALKFIGRVDFLLAYALEIVQLFAIVLPVQLCVQTFCRTFYTRKTGLFSLLVNIPLLLFICLTYDYFESANRIINGYLFPVFLLFSFLLPCLCPLLTFSKGQGHTRN